MPLTRRTNGSGGSNLVGASWWNDYMDLLTGVMTDQQVKIQQNLELKSLILPTTAMVAALATGTALGVGAYQYAYTFLTADGESTPSNITNITTTSGNQAVNLSSVPLGPAGTTGRRIYRTIVGGTALKSLTTINDNTTTAYSDTTTDSTLISVGVAPPAHSTFGGALNFKSNADTLLYQIANDGYHLGTLYATSGINTDGGLLTSDGNGNITCVGLTGNSIEIGPGGGMNGGNISAPTSPAHLKVLAPNGGYILFGYSTGVNTHVTLAEMKSNGNFLINGTTFQSTGTAALGNSGTFDAFDLAECYPCDQAYESGTIVCPGPFDRLTLCTHDNCHAAMVVTNEKAAFIAGTHDEANNILPIALVGRIRCTTQDEIHLRDLVCSDGKGGVRKVAPGESAHVIGFALESSHNGKIGIVMRPMKV